MKIGIVTFWDSSDNYGQLLQCYALQEFLRKNGHQPVLIKYKIETPREQLFRKLFRRMRMLLSPSHIRSHIRYRMCNRQNVESVDERYRFDDFRANYIESTEKIYYSIEELWSERWDIDCFICGSDQIWSPRSMRNLRAFFLDFIPSNKPKIAYAASFGRRELPKYYQEELRNLLADFKLIGVREQGGVEICRNSGCNDAKLVVDPTLLLEKADYEKLYKGEEIHKSIVDQVTLYLINWDTEISMLEIDEYVRQNKLSLRYYAAHGAENKFVSETLVQNDCQISLWLQSISQSRVVFTNSFHGTLFAIINHTPFVTYMLGGDSAPMNDRIISILQRFELLDRLYDGSCSLDEIISRPINWERVDELKQNFTNDSKKYLLESLGDQSECPIPRTVCFLTRGSVHHYYGGLDRVTEIIADYLEANGCRVLYLSQVKRDLDNTLRQRYLPNTNVLKSAENEVFFNEFLQSEKIDVIINQEGNVDLTIPIYNRDQVKVLTALHFNPNYITDSYFETRFANCSPFINNILGKLFSIPIIRNRGLVYLRAKIARNYKYQCSYADHFILLSDRFRKDMRELCNCMPSNVCSINNPIVLTNDHYQELSIEDKSRTLLYVGKIEFSQKRVDCIVKIWSQLADKFKDWDLKIVGDGPDRDRLESYVLSDAIPRVSILGTCDPKEYYRTSSILCFASSFEGWGMVLVEAQSMGCVPIAFNSYSSLEDIIEDGENGCVVQDLNIEEYIEKLVQLMEDDSLRYKMAQNSKDGVSRYDINNIGRQWVDLMNK